MGSILTALIALCVIAYAVYVVYRMIKNRGKCGGGCADCPYAQGCDKKRRDD